MPNMAAITVKKFDGTTDVIYAALAASAGDKIPAVWRADAAFAAIPPGLRPRVQASTKSNGAQNQRIISVKGVFPETYTDTTTGRVQVAGQVVVSMDVTVPTGMSVVAAQEGVYQLMNLLASPLMKQCALDGYSPV